MPIPEGHVLDDDGLLARKVGPHSRDKAHNVFRYADTVSTAMAGKWNIWWLELFSGPGVLFDNENKEFVPGSPIEALGVSRPFAGYSFGDLSPRFSGDLRTRVGDRPDVVIQAGDANDHAHIDRLLAQVPRGALVIAYLDPEGLELNFSTIRYLAERFSRIDFLLNLPVHQVQRELSRDRHSPRVKAMLEHDNPEELLGIDCTPHEAIRAHASGKFNEMGFRPPVGNQLRSAGNKAPMYDLLLLSRNEMAEKLYRRATQNRPNGQRSLKLQV